MKKRLCFTILVLFTLALAASGTVTSQNLSTSFSCSGGTAFTFTFPISDATALTVVENGVTLPSTSYTVVPVNANFANGGSVTLNTACPSGQTLVLQRITPLLQSSVFTDNMPIPMKTLERGLDKLTEIDQELSASIAASGLVNVLGGNNIFTGNNKFLGQTSLPLIDCGGQNYNVLCYGATGNGTTDDTSAIESAIAAAGANNQGGIVFFPCSQGSGYYKVASGPIAITKRVHLEGCLGDSLFPPGRIVSTSTTADLFQFNAGSEDSEVDHLVLNGPGCNNAPNCYPSNGTWYSTAGAGIDINLSVPDGTGGMGITVHDVTSWGFYYGIKILGGNRLWFHKLRLDANAEDGYYQNGAINLYMSEVEALYNYNAGFEIVGGGSFQWTDVTAYGSAFGFEFDGASSSTYTPVFFFGKSVLADTNSSAGFYFPNTGYKLGWFECDECWAAGTTGGSGLDLENSNLDGFAWHGGWFRNNYGPNIKLAAGNKVDVEGAKIAGAGFGNGSAQCGISVAAGVSYFQITDNWFGEQTGNDTGNQSTGVCVASGSSDYYTIAKNQFFSNTGTPVSDLGTGTHKYVETSVIPNGARVYNDATESIATATWTALTFDQERYDNGPIHSTSSNTSRLTAVTAGKYIISGQIAWAGSTSGTERVIGIRYDGSTYIATQAIPALGSNPFESISAIYNLAVGDYVELLVYQDTGSSLNVTTAGNNSPEFEMQWLGP